MGGTVKCSGAAKIKPPFEMGVDNFEKHEDPAGDGNMGGCNGIYMLRVAD